MMVTRESTKRTSPSPSRAALVAGVALVVLAGCASEPVPPEPVDVDAAYAWWDPDVRGVGFDQELVEGVLAVHDGCVVVVDEAGSVVPIFPTELSAWAQLQEGDPIALGGGGAMLEAGPADYEVPDECLALEYPYFLVSPDEDMVPPQPTSTSE